MTHSIEKLPILLIDAHSRCNCRCVMCDIWKTDEHREFTVVQLESQMEAIERLQVRWVVFTGGEPLMHSNLFALTQLLRARGVRVTILSTGLLFERFAREIAEHLDDAIVSLDGPPEIHDRIRRVPGGFARISEGVRAIHAHRPEFQIGARCTVQKANHAALVDTVCAARRIGLSSVSFLAADLTSTAFNREQPWNVPRQTEIALTLDELAVLEQQIDKLVDDSFVIDRPQHLHRIVQHFRAHLGLQSFEAPRCNAPWVSAVMGIDGSVRPCFFHPPVGSTSSQVLDETLNAAPARDFRASLDVASNHVCQRCVCSLYLGD
ncbi:MAG: Fe-S protein radical family [Bryobacterales bacterium]|nr:Fe-S protein radical family [Bryobacterales bacterium]